MRCPECEESPEMDAMGYGDLVCGWCGHTEYSESQENFNARMERLIEDVGKH